MFKVHENGDGSTSIFCSKTGKLICTIRKQQKSMGLGGRPGNIVEPSPKTRSCCLNIEANESKDLEAEPKEKHENSKDKNCDSPISYEPDEDFFGESVSPEDFARCLNLVSTEKFKNQPIDDLKSTFPLRLFPRTKASTGDVKIFEDLPITSLAGLKALKLIDQKNLYCDETAEMKIKNYENFCRFQINSTYVFNHPFLRCRDKKDYPISFPAKNSKVDTAHKYAFNRTQRLENLITIRTGLDTRSRKLLLRCNKRLAVSIKRLPDDEINHWMQKRARLGPIPAHLIRGEDSPLTGSDVDVTEIAQDSTTYIDIDLCSDDSSEPSDNNDPPYKCKARKEPNFQRVLSGSKGNLSPFRNQNEQSCFEMSYDSCVVLNNVLRCLRKCNGDYYIYGTNIKVPFLKDYLNSLDARIRNSLVFPETKLIINPKHDHAYHRPFSAFGARNLISNSNCLNHRNPKAKIDFKNKLKGSNYVKNKSLKHSSSVKNSNPFKPSISKSAMPELIDLTSSPPNSPVKKPKGSSQCWIFHCYGCGQRELPRDQLEAHYLASQHMKNYHCVTNPRSFLNTCYTPAGTVLEAFPGYKKD